MKRYIVLSCLAMIAVYCSIVVVVETHQQRQKYAVLNKLESAIDEEMYNWTQLLLERGSQASLPRVEHYATVELGMKKADLSQTEVFE